MRRRVLDWLRVRRRVWSALVAREILTRYGRRNLGFVWLVAEPVLFTLAIVALWSAVRGPVNPAMSVAGFALTGYATVMVWRNAASRCTQALKTNWALMYHSLIDPVDLYAVRAFIEAVSATMGLAVAGAALILLGLMQGVYDPLGLVLAWASLMMFGFGFALVVGALASASESFERIWHMLAYLLFPVSGPAFMVAWLPAPLQEWALWVPMVHATEWIRAAWFGPALITHENPAYLLGSGLVLMAVGLALVRKQGRVVEAAA
ncbi:MAG: ABC transporter permease [Rhodocyclaceae bacterium]|nr:ABC transporter permease [Rhodocyclaceae bacterium]